MVIRTTLILLAIVVGCFNQAGATPPSGIKLTYDVEKQVLHISAAHPSENMGKHYLRRIVIYKNDQEADALNLSRQKIPAGLEEDVSLAAQGGDKLSVEIFCYKGGSGKGEMTIPKEETEEKEAK